MAVGMQPRAAAALLVGAARALLGLAALGVTARGAAVPSAGVAAAADQDQDPTPVA